jgi:hypothetical protein
MSKHVACMGDIRNAYQILTGNPEGKRLPERPRNKWDDNIKLDLTEIWLGVMDSKKWLRMGTSSRLL